MAYKERYKVTAPVARSTAYDYNMQLTKSHQRTLPTANSEDRDVMPHEVLFEHRDKLKVGNARIHGCSSVNGTQLGHRCVAAVRACLAACGCPHADLFDEMENMRGDRVQDLLHWLEGTNDAAKAARAHASDVLTSFFTYMGVAITPCTAGARGGALARQGYSATRGGLMTIVNTGVETLRAGDKVRMVIDVLDVVRGGRDLGSRISGIPRSKIVARLAHVRPDASTFADVASGITLRAMTLRHDEPAILTPRFEYVGRLRYPWDWARDIAVVPPEAILNTAPLPFGVSRFMVADIGLAAAGANPVIALQQLSTLVAALDFADPSTYVEFTNPGGGAYGVLDLVQDIALNCLNAATTAGAVIGPDLWMLMVIRCCEALHYVSLMDNNGAEAQNLGNALVALFAYLDAQAGNPLYAPLLIVRGLVDYEVAGPTGNPPGNLNQAISVEAALGVATRLNALHNYKRAHPAEYTAFGVQYVAAQVSAVARADWNRAQAIRTQLATAAKCNDLNNDFLATTGGNIPVVNAHANAAAFVQAVHAQYLAAIAHVTAAFTRMGRASVIRGDGHRTLPPGAARQRQDHSVNAAVLLRIHSLM